MPVDRINPPTIRNRVQRFGVLAGVVATHVVLLLLLLLARGARPEPPPPPAGAIAMVSVRAEVKPAPAPPPPPALPSKVAQTYRPVNDAPPAEATDIHATAPAGGCTTLDAVKAALLADPAAIAAIVASPPETRSIADAIVLWNAQWNAAAPRLDGPLSPVRLTIETSLNSAEPFCLDEALTGPRLIPIPTGELTTFVVIGSGTWTWRELLRDDPVVPVDPAAPATTPLAPPSLPEPRRPGG